MKIINIRAIQHEASRAIAGWRGSIGQILVRVDTEDGLSGYGMGGGGDAGIHIVETVLKEALMGADASDVEGLWDHMYRETLAFGRKGVVVMAMSGVDLALWDLRGKREGKPVVGVLGGAPGEAIPTYRTGGLEGLEAARDSGVRAFKFSIGRMDPEANLEGIVSLFAKAREVVGPEVQVMTDVGMAWDVSRTLRVAEAISKFDLVWLEEPLPPDDWDGYEQLMRESPIPIASGEHEYTSAAFEILMQRGLHAIYQPDVCWCGGLTELVKIYQLAEKYDVRVCPHRGSEVWSLHAIAALDPVPLAESGRPWMNWVGGPVIEDGAIRLGDAPGLGVTFEASLW